MSNHTIRLNKVSSWHESHVRGKHKVIIWYRSPHRRKYLTQLGHHLAWEPCQTKAQSLSGIKAITETLDSVRSSFGMTTTSEESMQSLSGIRAMTDRNTGLSKVIIWHDSHIRGTHAVIIWCKNHDRIPGFSKVIIRHDSHVGGKHAVIIWYESHDRITGLSKVIIWHDSHIGGKHAVIIWCKSIDRQKHWTQ